MTEDELDAILLAYRRRAPSERETIDALVAEVRRLNDECQREADARGALERRLMRMDEVP